MLEGARTAGGPAIEAEGLSKRFGRHLALDRISFTAEAGRVLGIFGNNAAGKTTLLRVMAGQVPPSSGQARILGLDLGAHAYRLRRHVGYLSQQVLLYPELPLVQNLRLFADVRGLAASEYRRRFTTLCERLGLPGAEAEDVPAGRLPLGTRRRACLAFALLHQPAVLLLDEPVSGLDARDRALVFHLLRETAAGGACVVCTSHQPADAVVCHQLLLLDRGRVAESGTAAEIGARHGGVRARVIALPGQGALVRQHLHDHGYRIEWSARPEEPDEAVRVLLPGQAGDGELARLRAALSLLPGPPGAEIEAPGVEQAFAEVISRATAGW